MVEEQENQDRLTVSAEVDFCDWSEGPDVCSEPKAEIVFAQRLGTFSVFCEHIYDGGESLIFKTLIHTHLCHLNE